MLLLLIIAVILIAVICVIFPVLRTIIGIAMLFCVVALPVCFLANLFRGHAFTTAVMTLLKIAIAVAFALVFIRTLYFAIAWFGGV